MLIKSLFSKCKAIKHYLWEHILYKEEKRMTVGEDVERKESLYTVGGASIMNSSKGSPK